MLSGLLAASHMLCCIKGVAAVVDAMHVCLAACYEDVEVG
jgi:hypothetical protein